MSVPSLEHFFEWPTQLSPLLSKTSQLSTILSKSARLSTFLSAQKSKFTLESPFLSGFTLLSAFLSAQKSAQATSQPLCVKEVTLAARVKMLESKVATVEAQLQKRIDSDSDANRCVVTTTR